MPHDATTYTSPQLLSPDNHSLILVDQQYLVLITMRSHEGTQVVEKMALLAKGAKLFGVRTLLTTAHSETQKLVQQVQDAFPDHVPIERTGLDAFEDERVVAWVKEGGHKKIVITGLWTESCMTMTTLYGDIVVGDVDGLVIIPAQQVAAVISAAQESQLPAS